MKARSEMIPKSIGIIELSHWDRGLRMHRCVLHRQSIDDIGIVRYEILGVIALRADDPADIDNAMERLAADGAEILNALGRQNCSATRATLRCICHLRCEENAKLGSTACASMGPSARTHQSRGIPELISHSQSHTPSARLESPRAMA